MGYVLGTEQGVEEEEAGQRIHLQNLRTLTICSGKRFSMNLYFLICQPLQAPVCLQGS